MKSKGGIIITVVLIGLGVLFKYVIWPKFAVEAIQKVSGWEDARSEITAGIQTELTTGLSTQIDLPADKKDALLKCLVDKKIEFLNGTECKYYYAEGTTSEAEHLKNQEECLKKANMEAKDEENFIACALVNVPNTWALAAAAITKEFGAEMPAATRDCFVDGMVKAFDQFGCTLLNKEAKKAEEILTNPEKCMADSRIASEIETLNGKCLAK